MILHKEFIPKKDSSFLENIGDVQNARSLFIKNRHPNLDFLLFNRYNWMNDFIELNDFGIEIGAGAGFSKFYIKNNNLKITDNADFAWLDLKVDAINMPFENSSLNFIIESNVIHHLSKPILFFRESSRVLKPGGKILIQDVWGSFLLKLLCRTLNTEGYNYNVDVFDENIECTDPDNLWAGNNVILNLLFNDINKFEKLTGFKIEFIRKTEFLIFPLSGGVTSKINVPKLPKFILKKIVKIDNFFTKYFPDIFALQIQILLTKI